MKKKRYICGGIFAILLLFVCNISAYADDIKGTAAPTMLSFRDKEGKLVGEVSRAQYYCHRWDGNFSSVYAPTLYLKRGEPYSVEAVLSFYSTGKQLHTDERKLHMQIGTNVNGLEVRMDDPVTFKPAKTVNLEGINYTQYVDGQSEGEIKFESLRTSVPQGRSYWYTGIAFQANELIITDDMPDNGTIYILPGLIYKGVGDDWTMTDDLLQIKYCIGDPVLITEKLQLSSEFSEDGINMMIVNMMNSSRAENAKYKEVAVKVEPDYSERYISKTGEMLKNSNTYIVTYANGISAAYLEDYGIYRLEVNMLPDTDPTQIYAYAPPFEEFPAGMDRTLLEKKARAFAESKGFVGVKYFSSDQTEPKRYIMKDTNLDFSNWSGNISPVVGRLGLASPYLLQFFQSL